VIERIISFLKKDTRILAVYLLGSAGAGRLRPDSDIDLALLPVSGRHIDEFERVKLAADIALEIGREVDIGVISSNNLVYAKEALLGGKRIFVRDVQATDNAVATLLGMYVRFNEERWEVLDAYRA